MGRFNGRITPIDMGELSIYNSHLSFIYHLAFGIFAVARSSVCDLIDVTSMLDDNGGAR